MVDKERINMYEMKRQVTYSEVAPDLRVNMAGLVHYFQDCTIAHSETVGQGVSAVERTHRAWFLSSWQIEVVRYPEFMEQITVRTWAHAFKGMYGHRNFDLLDAQGKRIVQANSIWIFMDLEKMMPTRITEEDAAPYPLEPALAMEYDPRKIKVMEEEYRVLSKTWEPITVQRSFLDSNHHVNNGKYVEEAWNCLPEDVPIHKMRVDYRKAAKFGDVMYPVCYDKDGEQQVVFLDEGGNIYVIVEFSPCTA